MESYKKVADALRPFFEKMIAQLSEDRLTGSEFRCGHLLQDLIRSGWSEEQWAKAEEMALERAKNCLPIFLKKDLVCVSVLYGTHHPAIIFEAWVVKKDLELVKNLLIAEEEAVGCWEGQYVTVEDVTFAGAGKNVYFVWIRPDVVAKHHAMMIRADDPEQALDTAQQVSEVSDIRDLIWEASEDPKYRFFWRQHCIICDLQSLKFWRDDVQLLTALRSTQLRQLLAMRAEYERADKALWQRKRKGEISYDEYERLTKRAKARIFKPLEYEVVGAVMFNEYTLLTYSKKNKYSKMPSVPSFEEEPSIAEWVFKRYVADSTNTNEEMNQGGDELWNLMFS